MIGGESAVERAATSVIGAAIEVHRVLGPGYLEDIYVVTYLKATGHHLGLLLNFNVPMMSAGLKRVIR